MIDSDTRLGDLVDLSQLKKLLEANYAASGMPSGIIDAFDNSILAGAGWQDICTKFHRANRESLKLCNESDSLIKSRILDGKPFGYLCKNGLWDIGIPIIIYGVHFATYFLGQFSYEGETPDIKHFREQAEKYSYDSDAYIEALKNVPVFKRSWVETTLKYNEALVAFISSIAEKSLTIKKEMQERKSAEEAMRISEDRLSLAMYATNDGIYDWDMENRKIYFSPRFFTMLGYEHGELPSEMETLVLLLHPDDNKEVSYLIEKYRQGTIKSHEIELKMKTKDGAWRWILSRGKTVKHTSDGRPSRMIGTHVDITERKKSEEERLRMMLAVEQSGEMIVITDEEGIIQYVNPAFSSVTGFSREYSLGKKPSILKSGKHNKNFYKAMWKTIKSGKTWHGRIINRKKDDTLFTEDTTISPVVDSSGKTINFVAVKRDITKELNIEAQLRQAQKMEAVGQIAGGVAHDFNNILSAIVGLSSLAKMELEEDNPVQEHLDQILTASERATMLTKSLLTFSRKQVADRNPVSLNRILQQFEKLISRVIGENISVGINYSAPEIVINADSTQIEQVLMNLATNSRDAMPDGGTLRISLSTTEIDENFTGSHFFREPGVYALITVEDTGCGIDTESFEHIFEPFYTTKEVGKGTGLGLAIVYGILRQHNGYITVSSEKGKGTRFNVYLPTVIDGLEHINEKSAEVYSGGSETIMLVEDELALRSVTRAILTRVGYSVIEASDGIEAVEKFCAFKNDIKLILMDMVMPKMSGKEAYEKISAIKPDVKVLFMSGYSESVINSSEISSLGMKIIPKPVTPQNLTKMIRQTLDREIDLCRD